jgi:hypothetical protein
LTGMTTALPSTSGLNQIRFPVPDGMTVEQGSSKCGDQAQLSCCNEADYAGDTTKVADGLAAGLLSNLIGGGSSADGLGLFSQCSKLNVRCEYPERESLGLRRCPFWLGLVFEGSLIWLVSLMQCLLPPATFSTGSVSRISSVARRVSIPRYVSFPFPVPSLSSPAHVIMSAAERMQTQS